MTTDQNKPTPEIARDFAKTSSTTGRQQNYSGLDSYGRAQTGWILVNGKNRPHP